MVLYNDVTYSTYTRNNESAAQFFIDANMANDAGPNVTCRRCQTQGQWRLEIT